MDIDTITPDDDHELTNFDRFVAEQERDPKFKRLLDAERERLRRELDTD